MLSSSPFYHSCTRNLVTSFGSLINDIKVSREGGKIISVPVSVMDKQKFYVKLKNQYDEYRKSDSEYAKTTGVSITLPRLAFNVSSLNYDSMRQTPRMNKTIKEQDGVVKSQYNRVPYDFSIEMYVAVEYYEEGLQIIEQILPYFSPSFTLQYRQTDLDIQDDIQVILESADIDKEMQGDFMESNIITWALNFTAKGWLYAPTSDVGLIRNVDVNLNDYNTGAEITNINVQPDPDTAESGDDYEYDVTITEA